MTRRPSRVWGAITKPTAPVLACLTTFVLSACAGAPSPVATVTATRTVTAGAAASASNSAKPSSGTAAAPAVLRLGQVFTVPGEGFTAQALRFDDDAEDSDKDAERYVAVLVKVCATAKATSVSDAPWSLVGADDGTSNTVVTGGGLKEPQYIDGNSLAVGECARGWITFAIAKSQRVVRIKYAPGDDDGNDLPSARWVVG